MALNKAHRSYRQAQKADLGRWGRGGMLLPRSHCSLRVSNRLTTAMNVVRGRLECGEVVTVMGTDHLHSRDRNVL